MRLIRFTFSLAIIGGLGYVAFKVPLGKKTMVEHIRAIVDSQEGKELVDGVKQKAQQILKNDAGLKKHIEQDNNDKLTKEERDQLRKLIRKKLSSTDETP